MIYMSSIRSVLNKVYLFIRVSVSYTGSSKKMDGIWNRYNLKCTLGIYTFAS
jgi:hypothetical protein